MSKSEWTVKTIKKHFEKILEEKEKSYNQRFAAQENAIQAADHARDVAINKAEVSIEKKSDAVYVKLSDLQKTLVEVMRRPEIEARLSGLTEKIEDLKENRYKGEGKEQGKEFVIAKIISYILLAVAIAAFFLKK